MSDPRIEQILTMIEGMARGRIEPQSLASDRGDELDAILTGLDMLAEELSHTMVSVEEHKRVNSELNQALARVKTLRGMLPICSHCKKIREQEGLWTQIEKYLSEHTDATFTHGLCEACLEEHFPE